MSRYLGVALAHKANIEVEPSCCVVRTWTLQLRLSLALYSCWYLPVVHVRQHMLSIHHTMRST